MEIRNLSSRVIRFYVYSGFPHTEDNRVGSSDLAQGGSLSENVPSGTSYYVVFMTTNIGTIRPGLTIAASGGVPASGTVTLDKLDRISID
ncbi:MAG TPA: hypothetical protein VF142_20225 [Longimicrobium sp.]